MKVHQRKRIGNDECYRRRDREREREVSRPGWMFGKQAAAARTGRSTTRRKRCDLLQ